MEEKIARLKQLVQMSNLLTSVTHDYIENQGDYFDLIDTDLRRILSEKAHQLVDEMGIEAKG